MSSVASRSAHHTWDAIFASDDRRMREQAAVVRHDRAEQWQQDVERFGRRLGDEDLSLDDAVELRCRGELGWGDPVAGASVMLFEKPHRHEPGEQIEQVQGVETDDTGAYEFAGLGPGDYLIAVKARPWYANAMPHSGKEETDAEAALDVAYPVTYFDSTTMRALRPP